MKAKKAKFKIEQVVRCINEQQPSTIVGIVESAGYFYDVEHNKGGRTLRIAETDLVNFKTGK